MVVRLSAQDRSKSETMKNLIRFSPQACMITSEGMSLNVSTSLLSMYSSMLPSILSLHPCISNTIILPDFPLLTLSNLIELLIKGYSKQCSDDLEVQNMLDISQALGIDLDSLYLGSRKDSNNLFQVKQEVIPEEMDKDSSGETDFASEVVKIKRAESLGGKIKDIVRKRENIDSEREIEDLLQDSPAKSKEPASDLGRYLEELKEMSQATEDSPMKVNNVENQERVNTGVPNFKCEVCGKICLSLSLLGYHYCRHFSKDLDDLGLTEMIKDKTCLECKQNFYDRRALMVHIGVKHEYINNILQNKGITVLPFSQFKRKKATTKTKSERDVLSETKADVDANPSNSSESETKSSFYDLPQENVSIFTEEKGKIYKELQTLLAEKTQKDEEIVEKDVSFDNDGIKCLVCPNRYPTASRLRQHLCRHFREELKDACADIMQGHTCVLCSEIFKDKNTLLVHIGTRHGKLDDLLETKGLPKIILVGRTSKIKESSMNQEYESNIDENEGPEDEVTAPLYDGCTCLVCGKVFEREELTIEHVEFKHGKLKEDFEESKKTNKLVIKKSAEVKFLFNCEICNKEFDAVSSLSQHLVGFHFLREVKETFNHLYDGTTCLICSKTFPKQRTTVLHIGAMHRKIDQILEVKGLKPLKNEPTFKKIKEEVHEGENFVV